MAIGTPIQWTDDSVNPVNGCSGCELFSSSDRSNAICYAFFLSRLRKNHPGFTPDFASPKLFPGRMAIAAGQRDLKGTVRPNKPWLGLLPRMIFISDMGDALSEVGAIDVDNDPIEGGAVPFEFLKEEIIDAVMSQNGQRHIWQWLTKRPHRLKMFERWLMATLGLTIPTNLWIGTSVTSKKTLNRVKQLITVGNASNTRFLSVEPLWEEVSLLSYLGKIGWVIAGGESGSRGRAKPFECDWARKLRDECAAAGVPFFLKQLGGNVTDGGQPLVLPDGHGGDWNEWPRDLKVRQLPGLLP